MMQNYLRVLPGIAPQNGWLLSPPVFAGHGVSAVHPACLPRRFNLLPESHLSVEYILETRGLTKEFKGFVA
eukprot:gene45646-55871_t